MKDIFVLGDIDFLGSLGWNIDTIDSLGALTIK
jgi:hypothetical protein